MKITLSIFLNLLVTIFYSQEFVGEFNKVRPDSAFENIHIHQVSSTVNSTTFAIWIKRKVKIHKHIDHVENIYVTQGEGRFHLGATTYHVEPGDLIVVPKKHMARYRSNIPNTIKSSFYSIS